MSRPRAAVAVFFVLPFLGLVPLLAAQESAAGKIEVKKPEASKFIRVLRGNDKQPIALETAVVRYVPATGEGRLTVDLIGVVHVADRLYYEKLNQHFEQYDVLLYELVAPPGTRVPKGNRKGTDNPLALIQKLTQVVLGLEGQLEHIDYTRKNFVHADLSPQEMAEAIKQRGDDALTLTLSIVADLMRQQNQQAPKPNHQPRPEADLDPLTLLLDPDGPSKLKRAFAEQLAEVGSGAGLGPTLNAILIADRNQAALKVLRQELAKGHKKIGIFYGAAHMPDFEKRLREDFGLRRDSELWLTAWDLTRKSNPLEDFLKLLK